MGYWTSFRFVCLFRLDPQKKYILFSGYGIGLRCSPLRLYIPKRRLTVANLNSFGTEDYAELGSRFKGAHCKRMVWWMAKKCQQINDSRGGEDAGLILGWVSLPLSFPTVKSLRATACQTDCKPLRGVSMRLPMHATICHYIVGGLPIDLFFVIFIGWDKSYCPLMEVQMDQ